MRIFLLGATPSFDAEGCDGAKARLARTSGNTGNQVIAYGLLEALSFDRVEWDYSKGAGYVNANFDAIVIAAANFLHAGVDFRGMADFIEQTGLPVSMIGVGAQSKDYSVEVPILPGTLRLMQIVSERSRLIGVRGAFTQRVLEHIGITNTQIIGCPSYYMNRSRPLAIRPGPLPKSPRIAVNASRDVMGHSFDKERMRRAVEDIIREALLWDATFVAQTEIDEMTLADNPQAPEAQEALARLKTVFASAAGPSALDSWLRNRLKVYWDVPSWFEDMKACDFVFGTRFHGTLIALLAGTPGMVICHDSRTAELCEFLGVPNVSIEDSVRIRIQDLYERIDRDAITRRSLELIPAYREFLVANGLKPKLL